MSRTAGTLPRLAGGAGLSWQPLSAELVPVWQALIGDLSAADGGAEDFTEQELRDDLAPPWVDAARASVIALDGNGIGRAFGLVTIRPGDRQLLRAWVRGGVHPQWRGLGIGRSLMAWCLERARELVEARRAELGLAPDGSPIPAVAFTVAERADATVLPLVRRAGFDTDRFFNLMRRDLTVPVPAVSVPAVPGLPGLRLVRWRPELDEQVRLAHNESFGEHWLFQPWSPESWQRWQTGAHDFRPGWSHVVLDGERVAGYVLNSEKPQEGWSDKVGVLRQWRGRGLARALLLASMHSFIEADLQSAGLDVDTGNVTNAMRLYTGLGYRVRERAVQATKPL